MRAEPRATAGLAGVLLSLGCFLTVALCGPSAMQPRLPGRGAPWSFQAEPSPYLVIAVTAAGMLAGTFGLAMCLLAVRRGWRPDPRPLLVAGLVCTAVFAVLPPVGSADHLNYAGYGHMVVTGHDPYTTTATGLGDEPYGRAIQEWRDAPSIYGPIITAQQALAARIGGDSVRATVLALSLTNALAFAAVALLLYFRTGDPQARLRSVLLWTLNPLLLFPLVSGAHNDVLGIAAAVLALTLFSCTFTFTLWRTLATGVVLGAAVAMKFPAAVVGAGPAWAILRRRGDRWPLLLGALFGGAALVALVAFGTVSGHAFDQVRRAADRVSLATPSHLVAGPGGGVFGFDAPRTAVTIGSLAVLVCLVWLLARALPGEEGVRVSAALVLAWLFAASYALPWYDGLGWAVLVFLPWSRFDWLLLARTAALSLAYLPARRSDVIGLPGDLLWLERDLRSDVMPFVLTALLGAVVWTCLRRPAPEPVRTQPAPAESRR
ncbi:MAG: hypothetical protein ABIS86_11215 [Streptosporangiaceae bacterium]